MNCSWTCMNVKCPVHHLWKFMNCPSNCSMQFMKYSWKFMRIKQQKGFIYEYNSSTIHDVARTCLRRLHLFMNSSWIVHEQFMNKSWTGHEQFMKYLVHEIFSSWTVHDSSWTVHEQFMKYLVHEQFMKSLVHEIFSWWNL